MQLCSIVISVSPSLFSTADNMLPEYDTEGTAQVCLLPFWQPATSSQSKTGTDTPLQEAER